jgi:hypothetical protein
MDVRIPASVAEQLILSEVNKWTKNTSPFTYRKQYYEWHFSDELWRDYYETVGWADTGGSFHTCWMAYHIVGKPMTHRVIIDYCDADHYGKNDQKIGEIVSSVCGVLRFNEGRMR